MQRLAQHGYSILVALWVGGLWAIGGLAAPTLFRQLADRALAGQLAGAMFEGMAWFGMGAAAYLLLYLLVQRGTAALKLGVFWLIIAMLTLTLVGHFGIQPIIAKIKADGVSREITEALLRNRFATWHGIASGLYVLQSLLGLVLVVIQEKGKR